MLRMRLFNPLALMKTGNEPLPRYPSVFPAKLLIIILTDEYSSSRKNSSRKDCVTVPG